MKLNLEQWRGVAACICLVFLGLLTASSLSAQELNLRLTLKGHTGTVVGLAYSPDSKTLASASHDGTLRAWDMTTGEVRVIQDEYEGCLGYVAFSPDGKILASGAIGSPGPVPDLGDVKLWDVATGNLQTALKPNTEDVFAGAAGDVVHSVAFSPDGKTLAAMNGDVTLWDLATNKELVTLIRHTKEDRRTKAAAYGVMSVAFSPDGKTLAAASRDMTVKVWDMATAKRSTLLGHTHAVYCVSFSPDGKTLASASGDKTVRLWDLATGKERATLKGHSESVMSVAFSPDGKLLASASFDKTVKLWDVATGKERVTLTGSQAIRSVAFSPDGKMLASSDLRVWDIPTNKYAGLGAH